jgi:hypothetical protein
MVLRMILWLETFTLLYCEFVLNAECDARGFTKTKNAGRKPNCDFVAVDMYSTAA